MAGPRNDRGWKPLPQKQDLLDDKAGRRAMTRRQSANGVSLSQLMVSLLLKQAQKNEPAGSPFPAGSFFY
jgi:hypothetical protein